jgi:hypothetical protein
MKYKCLGSPLCLKTFDSGHTLKAHLSSCDKAQNFLKNQNDKEKLEHNIAVEYAGIYGLHRNTYFPSAHHIDQTNKFHFKDKANFIYSYTSSSSNLNSNEIKSSQSIRPIRKLIKTNLMDSTQTKTIMMTHETN